MKAVMYHYIRKYQNEYPNFKYLHADDFCKQLDYFEETYGFVSQNDFIKSLETGEITPGIILTFDDAFKDHYTYVFPELKKRGLWGVFYIPTLPLVDHKILDVHRIHLLLGKFGGKKILTMLTQLVDDTMLSDKDVDDYHQLTYSSQKQDENKDEVKVKRILNYFVSYQYRNELINNLMANLFKDERVLLQNLYLTVTEMTEMKAAGMVFGSHTVSHPVLSKLDNESQRNEILNSFAFLQQYLGASELKSFCYPHGGFHTFTPYTEKLLSEQNVNFSFNVEARSIEKNDLLNRPQALPRFDCNAFPYGSYR